MSTFFLPEQEKEKKKEEKERKKREKKGKKKEEKREKKLTREDQPVDGVEQPPELPVRDVKADRHGPSSRRLDPLDVGRGDIGTFFFEREGEKRKRSGVERVFRGRRPVTCVVVVVAV